MINAATAPGLSYVHEWRKSDVVMWDNRATMHRGRPWPAQEARHMVRTTISATSVQHSLTRARVVPVGNSRSDVLMVQPTQDRDGQRLTNGLDGAGDRRVLL